MKTMLNTKIDSKLKKELQKTAKDMGLSVSALLNNAAKQIIEERSVVFRAPLIPNKKTAKELKKALTEIKSGAYKKWPRFNSGEELIAHLHRSR